MKNEKWKMKNESHGLTFCILHFSFCIARIEIGQEE